MVAYYVSQVKHMENEISACVKEIGIGEKTFHFWQFVAGIMDSAKLKMLIVCFV